MKSTTILSVLFIIVLMLCVQGCSSTVQTNRETTLEQRVQTLEQKVKMLESRLGTSPTVNRAEVIRSRLIMMNQIQKISQSANQYFWQQSQARNGSLTYKGFTPPVFNDPMNVATYAVTPSDTDIVIEGRALNVNGTISGRMVRQGQVGDWQFTGDFSATGFPRPSFTNEFLGTAQTMSADINAIIADAQRYHRSSGAQGRNVWDGYAVPQAQASHGVAWYLATPTGSDLEIEGHSKKSYFIRKAVLDSSGRVVRTDSIHYAGMMKTQTTTRRTTADSIREMITNDFKTFASRARQYRTIPLNSGGGGGKYSGYLSAQTASLDGQIQYALCVDPDVILLKAVSLAGLGTMSAKVDGGGNLSAWYYTGKLAE